MVMRSMPEGVQSLREPWPSQVDEVKGLTWELEQDFRFGQRITKTERGYVMGGTMKGGSSSMWYPATREQYHAFRRWQNLEGLHEARDDEALGRLSDLLAKHRIRLLTRRKSSPHARRKQRADIDAFPGYGPLYADMLLILEQLPTFHLDRETLTTIQLGGWGPDAAKASAYQDGKVLMYDFACRGARRTFLGLFLHELGHAHETWWSDEVKDGIYADYKVLLEEDAFFGVEFLVDGATRKLYQKFVFTEFLAETYMIYIACGAGMREAITAMPAAAKAAWTSIYQVFRESFDGIEYE